MSSTRDPLLSDGLFSLGSLLPPGYTLSASGLGRRGGKGEIWVVIRSPAGKHLTCLVVARRRIEPRDLGNIAALAVRSGRPTLVASSFLAPVVRERLRALDIGFWDLTGNAHIALARVSLHVDRDGDASAQGRGKPRIRTLAGATAGRIVRVLVDFEPPFSLSQVANLAHADIGRATRVLGFLVEEGIAVRRPRGKVEKVDWQALLRRWLRESPLATRGTLFPTRCARGVPHFLSRLAPSGLLHALTGRAAFSLLAATPMPAVAVLYVDDVPDAIDQLGLHPEPDEANVILVKPTDRSVYHRSRETNGLRHVSPSLIVADLDEPAAIDTTLRWLAQHATHWRIPVAALRSSPQTPPHPTKRQGGRMPRTRARPARQGR